jgi:hypothetical protein
MAEKKAAAQDQANQSAPADQPQAGATQAADEQAEPPLPPGWYYSPEGIPINHDGMTQEELDAEEEAERVRREGQTRAAEVRAEQATRASDEAIRREQEARENEAKRAREQEDARRKQVGALRRG